MKKINDGGLAFPGPCQAEQSVDINEGMSLRDYFAAAALQGLMAHPTIRDCEDEFARAAFRLADAMLSERERRNG
jgi:hypothetical protein